MGFWERDKGILVRKEACWENDMISEQMLSVVRDYRTLIPGNVHLPDIERLMLDGDEGAALDLAWYAHRTVTGEERLTLAAMYQDLDRES